MPYKFKCRECKKFVYIDVLKEIRTVYNCQHCGIDNQMTPKQAEKNFKIEKIDQEEYDLFLKGDWENLANMGAGDQAGDQTMKKVDARNKLKEAKENLELELITQKEYDTLKEELKPIIMSQDEDSNDEKELSQPATSQPVGTSTSTTTPEQKKTSKWVWIGGVLCILWLIGLVYKSTSSTYL